MIVFVMIFIMDNDNCCNVIDYSFSALRVNGKRMYDLAREAQTAGIT